MKHSILFALMLLVSLASKAQSNYPNIGQANQYSYHNGVIAVNRGLALAVGDTATVNSLFQTVFVGRRKEGLIIVQGTSIMLFAQGAWRVIGSGSGSGVQQAQPGSSLIVSPAVQSVQYGTDYVFTGTSAIYTLPEVSSSFRGRQNLITIKNRGTGNITVNAAGGTNTIYGSSLTNTFTIAPGEAYTLLPDGAIFNVE